ncbi:MAG: rhomboid family intramembrane serine protease [Flavobacteriaceae bacterium]
MSGLKSGQWYRLLTSGFLHVGWWHLLVNGLTFYFFAPSILSIFGTVGFLGLYLFSLLTGNLLTYFYYHKEYYYTAVGASGAISGVVFSSLIFDPSMKLYILPLPFPIPAPLFGLGFLGYSMVGILRNSDRIGHAAHMGGGIGGILFTFLFYPSLLRENPLLWVFLSVIFLALFVIKKLR